MAGEYFEQRIVERSFRNMKTRKKAPEIILRNGEPAAVIIDIDHYREML